MDWPNERYVRLYTRNSTTWKMIDWRARCVFMSLLRVVDRGGVLDVGDHGVIGLAAAIELPLEVVEPGIAQLLDPRFGTVAQTATAFVIPNFLEAQEASQTQAHRSRAYRERRRQVALGHEAPTDEAVTKSGGTVTKRDAPVTKSGATVTPRHAPSQTVTPSLAEPNQSEEELPLPRARAIPPPSSTEQGEELATSPEPSPEPEPPRDVVPIADRQDLRRRSWARLGEIRAQVARELGVTARPLAVFDPGERELGERIREAGDRAEADVEHVLAVLADEARSKGTVEWLTGGVFRPDRWVRALGMTREDATRTRSPARASWHQQAADEAPRKLRRL